MLSASLPATQRAVLRACRHARSSTPVRCSGSRSRGPLRRHACRRCATGSCRRASTLSASLSDFAARPFERAGSNCGARPGASRKPEERQTPWRRRLSRRRQKGKFFAIIADHHHGEEAVGLRVKASSPDEMTCLIEAQPDIYYCPKYYGRVAVGMKLNRRDVDWDQVGECIAEAGSLRAAQAHEAGMRAADRLLIIARECLP